MRLRFDDVRLDVRAEEDDDNEPVVGFVRDGTDTDGGAAAVEGAPPIAGAPTGAVARASGARPQVLQ
jgi:hypothetical protein